MEKQTQGRKAFLDYLPAAISSLCTLITIFLYTRRAVRYLSVYLAMAVMAVVPPAIVFINRRGKLGLPRYLICLMCLHAVLSTDMGTAMGFYGRYAWWDVFVHGFFGFLASATLYYLFPRLKGGSPNLLDMIVMVLLVISFAALWEVYEFFAGIVCESDMQDVQSAIAQGIPPLTDTVSDMLIATFGAVLFFPVLTLMRRLIRSKSEPKQQEGA